MIRDVDTNDYILNGDFVMSMFRKTIQYGGTTLEYSGSDSVVERVNSSLPLRKDLLVEVLTVGNLNPPQVHYRYVISKTSKDTYKWKSLNRLVQLTDCALYTQYGLQGFCLNSFRVQKPLFFPKCLAYLLLAVF